ERAGGLEHAARRRVFELELAQRNAAQAIDLHVARQAYVRDRVRRQQVLRGRVELERRTQIDRAPIGGAIEAAFERVAQALEAQRGAGAREVERADAEARAHLAFAALAVLAAELEGELGDGERSIRGAVV